MKRLFIKGEEEHSTMNMGRKMVEKPSKLQPYSRYENFVEQAKIDGWSYVGDMESYSLTHMSTNMVTTFPVKKGKCGIFLDIMCPSPNHMLTVCGFDDAGIDPMDFYKHPNLYKIPHYLMMTCKDNSDNELSHDVVIDINTIDVSGEPTKLCSEPYGDLSHSVNGRFRRKEERYYFSNSIKLEDRERLSFRVNSPDIDIEITNLFMKADIFVRDI